MIIVSEGAQRHNYMAEYIHAHSSSHAIKALIVSPLITSLSAVFPFLHSLTCSYLRSLSSGQRGLWVRRQKGTRGGGEKGAATRGHEKGAETRGNGLIWDGTHTQEPLFKWLRRGALWSKRQRLMNAWPLFLPHPSFHLLSARLLTSSSWSSRDAGVSRQQEVSTWEAKELECRCWKGLQLQWHQQDLKALQDFPESLFAWMNGEGA